jgi:hypothetical protein
MAVKSRLTFLGEGASLLLRPDEPIERLADSPDDVALPGVFYPLWDADKLERGVWELAGVLVPRTSAVSEKHLRALDRLETPRVDCKEAGMIDATVADVLRWAVAHAPPLSVEPKAACR